jgi:hypothetical protein
MKIWASIELRVSQSDAGLANRLAVSEHSLTSFQNISKTLAKPRYRRNLCSYLIRNPSVPSNSGKRLDGCRIL